MKKDFKNKLKTFLQFILNPRLLLCLGIAWLITNGWSYILFGFGTYYQIPWMVAVASAYLTFLWLPISPEKIFTAAIALTLLRILFPKDEKTLAVFIQMFEEIKRKTGKKKKKDNAEQSEKKDSDEK